MNYRRLANADVSELTLDATAGGLLGEAEFGKIVSESLEQGINLFYAIKPEECSALGAALKDLQARRNAIVAAGIEDFFRAFARHEMRLGEFLEHELSDRLERLDSTYLDCLVIDLGRGRGVDLEAVRAEGISGGNGKAMELETFEGGTFLHETIQDCLETIDRFRQDGLIRMAGISGENIDALTRVLVKHSGFDVVFAPFNYAFRAAAKSLIPVAAEQETAVVTTRPLWWDLREIPVSVLAESPYPLPQAQVEADASSLAAAACKWPLTEKTVVSVAFDISREGQAATLVGACRDEIWTRSDEETLRPVAAVAESHQGLFVALSAMNSPDDRLRQLGWATLQRKGLAEDLQFDPAAEEDLRRDALREIAAALVPPEPPPPDEEFDDLL